MALRQMSEAEKQELAMGKLMRKLAANPKTRRNLLNVVRQADPAAVQHFPDQQVEDLRRQIAADKEKEKLEREAAEHRTRMDGQRSALVGKYGEARVKDIEGLMTKHGLHDYELGAKLYSVDTPEGKPALEPPRSSRWTMPDDKELLENPADWANTMAHTVINEMRGRVLGK